MRLMDAHVNVVEHQQTITPIEDSITLKQERLKQPDCGWLETVSLNTQILGQKGQILYFKRQLSGPEGIFNSIKSEETDCQRELDEVNQSLNTQRKGFVTTLTAEAKQTLATYLQDKSKEYVGEMEQELQSTATTIDVIEKTELEKSRYQRCRFFSIADLLKLEADLAHEKECIPQRAVPRPLRNRSCAQEIGGEEHRIEPETSFVF
jgi:hypothetical protein